MNDKTGTGDLMFKKVEAKKSWWPTVKPLLDFLASIGILLCFFWCLFCISTVDARIKTLHQRIDTLKMVTDSKFEAASSRMDGIQEKLPSTVLASDSSRLKLIRTNDARCSYMVDGSAGAFPIFYWEGPETNGYIYPKRLVVKTNFTGVVYVQRKNGSFEVVYP